MANCFRKLFVPRLLIPIMDEIEFHGTITINDSIKGNGNFLLCDLICRYLKKLPTHRVCLIGSTRPQEHYVALGRKLVTFI